jgi:uncharacterized protein YecE (DUF72 family)
MRGIAVQGHDLVYAYFNNDAFGHALENARELREIVEEDGHDRV